LPRARSNAEAAFLSLGDGATLWLTEAAVAGAARVRAKMAEAVELAALHTPEAVDRALGQAADFGLRLKIVSYSSAPRSETKSQIVAEDKAARSLQSYRLGA
jgi:hypothetical protein